MLNKTGIFLGCVFLLCASGGAVFACERDSFGSWKQKDLMNTRQLVLQRDGKELDWFEYGNGAFRITNGTWRDGLSGRMHYNADARTMEIDHVVPLCFAWDRGAKGWTSEKQREFFNDVDFLIVTFESQNASKSDNPPWITIPMEKSLACNYVRTFREGIERYELALTQDEWGKLASTEADACSKP